MTKPVTAANNISARQSWKIPYTKKTTAIAKNAPCEYVIAKHAAITQIAVIINGFCFKSSVFDKIPSAKQIITFK